MNSLVNEQDSWIPAAEPWPPALSSQQSRIFFCGEADFPLNQGLAYSPSRQCEVSVPPLGVWFQWVWKKLSPAQVKGSFLEGPGKDFLILDDRWDFSLLFVQW